MKIKHYKHGEATLLKSSIRYYKDRRHPYGWEIGFSATFQTSEGVRFRDSFSALGTTRGAAKFNALRS